MVACRGATQQIRCLDNSAVRAYWNDHIHDLDISANAPGSREFFADLDQYHFEKLHHLPRLVDFNGLSRASGAGRRLRRRDRSRALREGRRARHRCGPLVVGDRAGAKQNFAQQGLAADLREADGERLPFHDNQFDLVFAHGVVQYTSHDRALVDECHRVLKPGGTAVFQVYNRISWLNGLSKVMKVPLEHEDAPVLKRYSAAEFRALLTGFRDVRIVEERFPVKSRLHGGWKGTLFNTFFVGTFNALPKSWVRRFGWHLLAFCTK